MRPPRISPLPHICTTAPTVLCTLNLGVCSLIWGGCSVHSGVKTRSTAEFDRGPRKPGPLRRVSPGPGWFLFWWLRPGSGLGLLAVGRTLTLQHFNSYRLARNPLRSQQKETPREEGFPATRSASLTAKALTGRSVAQGSVKPPPLIVTSGPSLFELPSAPHVMPWPFNDSWYCHVASAYYSYHPSSLL